MMDSEIQHRTIENLLVSYMLFIFAMHQLKSDTHNQDMESVYASMRSAKVLFAAPSTEARYLLPVSQHISE